MEEERTRKAAFGWLFRGEQEVTDEGECQERGWGTPRRGNVRRPIGITEGHGDHLDEACACMCVQIGNALGGEARPDLTVPSLPQ